MNSPHSIASLLFCQVSGRLLVLREMVLGGAGALEHPKKGGSPSNLPRRVDAGGRVYPPGNESISPPKGMN